MRNLGSLDLRKMQSRLPFMSMALPLVAKPSYANEELQRVTKTYLEIYSL